MSFEDRCRSMITEHEGCISHMYLDPRGFVTVAVGQLLAKVEAAQELAFVKRDSGAPAAAADIARDYQTVKQQAPGKSASFYKPYTRLDLPESAMNALFDKRIEVFEADLRADFPDYDSFPDAAKLGLMDMVFNLGNAGLVDKFPSLTSAARAHDWVTCANECHRRGIGNERNEMTKKLFEEAAAPA